MDVTRPIAEAFAVRGGRFVFVGATRDAMLLKGPATRVLDLHGATAYPGFIDAHAHLLGLGPGTPERRSHGHAVVRGSHLARRRAREGRARRPVDHGRRLGSEPVACEGIPHARRAHQGRADHPVLLNRVDGHAVLANAAAMKAAGITAKTPDPRGGRILRDKKGNPTGVFVDNAQSLFARSAPRLTQEQLAELLHSAAVESNKWGLTEVQDMGEDRATIEALESLAHDGEAAAPHL